MAQTMRTAQFRGQLAFLTGRSKWLSGIRQLLIGLAAATVTFSVGRLLDVAMGG